MYSSIASRVLKVITEKFFLATRDIVIVQLLVRQKMTVQDSFLWKAGNCFVWIKHNTNIGKHSSWIGLS